MAGITVKLHIVDYCIDN